MKPAKVIRIDDPRREEILLRRDYKAARREADEIRAALIAALRRQYQERIREIAARLAPSLGGRRPEFTKGDNWKAPSKVLEDECRWGLCSTLEDARIAYALSPHWDRENAVDYDDFRDGAVVAVAHDVAKCMRADWYMRLWISPGVKPRWAHP